MNAYFSYSEERIGNGNGGKENDTRCIVVVVVVEPECARKHLKYVEGRQDLAKEEHENRG